MKSLDSCVDNILSNDSLSLLEDKLVEQEIEKLRNSKKITIEQLKAIYDIGVDFYNKFQLKEAEIIFSSYASLNPYDHRGVGCLASIYLEQGEFLRALGALNILKTFPTSDFDEVIVNITLCHYKLGDYTNAASMLLIIDKNKLNDFYAKRFEFLKQQLNPYI